MTILQAISTLGVPSLIISVFSIFMTRKLNKMEKAQEARAKAQTEHTVAMINMGYGALALGEATALAVKNQKCNGEMAEALEYAKKVKNEHKDFINKQGAIHLCVKP